MSPSTSALFRTGANQANGTFSGSRVARRFSAATEDIHFRPLLGGSQGIGAALLGTLANATDTRSLNFLGSNLDLTGDRTVADFNSATAITPGGYRSVLGDSTDPTDLSDPPPPATLIDATPNTSSTWVHSRALLVATVPLGEGAVSAWARQWRAAEAISRT